MCVCNKRILRENVTLNILFWLYYSQIYTFSSLFWKPRVIVQCSWQILIIEVSTQWGIIWSILSETTAIPETWNIMIKLTNLLSCIMHTFSSDQSPQLWPQKPQSYQGHSCTIGNMHVPGTSKNQNRQFHEIHLFWPIFTFEYYIVAQKHIRQS